MDKTQFEKDFDSKVQWVALWALALHVPASLGLAWYFGSSLLVAGVLGLAIALGPWGLRMMRASSLVQTIAIGVASTSFSALFIHLGRGMIEMHFHIFGSIAAVIALASRAGVLAAAGTTAVHHIAFFFILPASLFNYDAGFGMVLVHATFVVVTGVPAYYISQRYRSFVQAQGVIFEELGVVAESVSLQTGKLTRSSRELASGASRQAASIEETSASLEEVSSGTLANAESARSAKELASKARSIAERGSKEMEAMNEAMLAIRESSNGISQILKTIDEIAFQTNILALNAAVEAARAGESGAGFAVVADEVRNLAQRSAVAAQETADKIQLAVQRSERGAELSQSVSEQLGEIFAISRDVDTLVGSIAEASSQQSSGLEQISRAVVDIDAVTQSSAANAEETEQDAVRLNELSNRLSGALTTIGDILGNIHETGAASHGAVSEFRQNEEDSFESPKSRGGAQAESMIEWN